MNKLFCYLLALVFTTSHANASIFDGVNSNHNLYTHTQNSLKLEPASSYLSANVLLQLEFIPHTNKLAAAHWLPDFQESFNSRSNTGGGNGDKTSVCSTYNLAYVSAKPDANKYDFTTKNNVDGQGLKCYANVKCKAKFQYTSANCSGNYTPSGPNCDSKFESCNCKSEFKFNTSNCSGEYQLSGTSCNGNYNACAAKSCSAGGYFDAAQADRKCSGVTYGGRTCQSCYQPQCSEGGFDSANKTGSICTAKAYYGRTCYACSADPCYGLKVPSQPYGCQATYPQCPSKCQTAYPDNCRNRTAKSCDYGCQSNFADCSSKCETCKGNPDCNVTSQTCTHGCATTNSCSKCTSCKACVPVRPDSSFIEGNGSCWAGQTLVTSSDGCGKPYHKCTGAATCASHGFVDACPAGQTGTAVTSAGGGRCFKECKASDVPCISPNSKDVTSCTSPYKLYTQPSNDQCRRCVNECSSYTTSPNCMNKSFMENNSGYGDEMYNILYGMGQPEMQSEESCPFNSSYKRCVNDKCNNVNDFVSKMKDGMKQTLCSLNKTGINNGHYSLCDSGFGGINFLPTDYNIYIRLLDEGVCGVTAETNIRSCRNMMDAAKNYVSGC